MRCRCVSLCRPEYYKEVIEARKGIMTKADFTKIRRCLHPDWVQDVERKPVYETAFHLFTKLEKLLLNEKDEPDDVHDDAKDGR